MKEKELTEIIIGLTENLLDMVSKNCSNKINNNCQYIISKIYSTIDTDFIKQQRKDWNLNNQKTPKYLDQIID